MTDSLVWRRLAAVVLALATMLGVATPAFAQQLPAYTARAGMLAIGADDDRPDAEIFHIAYTADGADPATRPVTFVFNGGPGAASIYLHLSAIGPRTIVSAGDGSFPATPAQLEDNPDSWIGFTDLVFIDPVGTGYSRMLPGPDGAPGDPKPYYSVESDLHSIARFMRKWLTVNKRWGSPKAIAGESYGGQRVAALMRMLAEQYAINLNRAVMISPALNFEVSQSAYSILYPMSLIPTQIAIAAYHGKSTEAADEAGMRAVEAYALGEYLTGLVSVGRMSEAEKTAFYGKLAGMIGIDPAIVALRQGRFTESIFGASLLADKGLILDRYDGTQATGNPTPEADGIGVFDRSLTILAGILLPPFMDYVRNDLGYVSERAYIPIDFVVNAGWDRTSSLGGPDDVGIALAQNTDLKALVVHGYHDLMTNYFLSRYVLEQTTRAADARKRLFFGTYKGGHMFYLRKESRAEFTADVREFFQQAR